MTRRTRRITSPSRPWAGCPASCRRLTKATFVPSSSTSPSRSGLALKRYNIMNCFVHPKSCFSHVFHWNGSAEAIFNDVGIGTEKETSRLHLFGHVGVDTARKYRVAHFPWCGIDTETNYYFRFEIFQHFFNFSCKMKIFVSSHWHWWMNFLCIIRINQQCVPKPSCCLATCHGSATALQGHHSWSRSTATSSVSCCIWMMLILKSERSALCSTTALLSSEVFSFSAIFILF